MQKLARITLVAIVAGGIALSVSACTTDRVSSTDSVPTSSPTASSDTTASAKPTKAPVATPSPTPEPTATSNEKVEVVAPPVDVEVPAPVSEPEIIVPDQAPVAIPETGPTSFAEPPVPMPEAPAIIPPTGQFASMWAPQAVAQGSTGPVQLALSIDGGGFSTHQVSWTIAGEPYSTVEAQTAFDYEQHNEIWLATVKPGANGFKPGTTTVIATVTVTETSEILGSKSFTLNVN